jgi:secreted trypsin-like serine protease
MFSRYRKISSLQKKTAGGHRKQSIGTACLVALSAVCLTTIAKTAHAQEFTGPVYAATNDGQKNRLVAYGSKSDGTLAYIGSIYLAVQVVASIPGGRSIH